MTRDLLIEIGSEEIPARMLDAGVADLRTLLEEAIRANGLATTAAEAYHTPRRLAVLLHGIEERQPDREEIAYGPPVAASFGPDGAPTKAAEGFARGQGVAAADLVRAQGPKGEVVAVRRVVAGRPTLEVLAEVLPATLLKLQFPKAMHWMSHTGPYARPVHWVVALFGGDVVPFTFHGIASGRSTVGHRFQAPDPVDLPLPSAYVATLHDRHVVVDPAARKATVRQAMVDTAARLSCRFITGDALMTEVANLVEDPVFAVGGFDPDFLRVPREVLVTAMASHQRYFGMEDASGKLLPRFGVVANNRARDMGVVVRGNERVLAARLYDARFFWEQDLKHGLPHMGTRLNERLFLKGAGDMAQKTLRIAALAGDLCDAAGLDAQVRADAVRAAGLCKADLMSAMVGEFPELQGVMGQYYARHGGESEAVAGAIREHYLPRFAGDDLPATPAGAVLAVADRIDSIVQCFNVGAVPTGSKDPLALRRQAIAVLKILAARSWSGVTLSSLLGPCRDDAVRNAVVAFVGERFSGILTADLNVPTDFAAAVLAADFAGARPADTVARAVSIRDFALEAEGFRDFLDSVYKRVLNLLKQADEKVPGWREAAQSRGLLDIDGDFDAALGHELEKLVESTRRHALGAYHRARESGVYHDLLAALYTFKDPLARFFGTGRDGVPVLIEEDELKRLGRLALLHRVFQLFGWFADFGRISTR